MCVDWVDVGAGHARRRHSTAQQHKTQHCAATQLIDPLGVHLETCKTKVNRFYTATTHKATKTKKITNQIIAGVAFRGVEAALAAA